MTSLELGTPFLHDNVEKEQWRIQTMNNIEFGGGEDELINFPDRY